MGLDIPPPYAYDTQGQLLTARRCASGGALQGAAAYTYDTVGNLLTATDGTTTHTYTYGDAQWRDLLTAYDGGAISYDAIGNPLRYYDGTAFQWTDGRRLASRTKDGQTTSYAYNEDGLRTRKTNPDGSYSDYYWVGTQLLAEVQYQADGTESRILKFCYDEKNSPIGFVLTDGGAAACYYFGKNLQGDVIGLYRWNWSEDYHHTMTLVATYDYDPWGKLLSITDPTGGEITGASDPANLNPFRYRGYYQDSESGFYYLQSRYYDPQISRFLNADDYSDTNDGYLGYNMFAYCLNNPVNRTDSNGNWSLPNWAKVAIGAVALAGAVALTVATGGGAAAVAIGVAKVVGSVAVSTAVSAGVGYLNDGKQGAIDGACNGFMFGSLSACGGAALKYVSSAANKASVATSLSEPKKVANTITGYTKHGLNQAIGRNGVGVKPSAILDAVRNPVDVVTKIDKLGRISTQYRGTQSTVVLNEIGKVVSCWAKSSKYWRI